MKITLYSAQDIALHSVLEMFLTGTWLYSQFWSQLSSWLQTWLCSQLWVWICSVPDASLLTALCMAHLMVLLIPLDTTLPTVLLTALLTFLLMALLTALLAALDTALLLALDMALLPALPMALGSALLSVRVMSLVSLGHCSIHGPVPEETVEDSVYSCLADIHGEPSYQCSHSSLTVMPILQYLLVKPAVPTLINLCMIVQSNHGDGVFQPPKKASAIPCYKIIGFFSRLC